MINHNVVFTYACPNIDLVHFCGVKHDIALHSGFDVTCLLNPYSTSSSK